MPIKELNKQDLWFTADGDFLIDGAGDLKDTSDSGDLNEGVRQAVLHRILSEKEAFRLHPEISAGLESFIGKSIDRQLMENIEFAIHRSLISDGTLTKEDYAIRVLELTPGDLAILIYLNLPNQDKPLISMAWNIKSGDITRVL